MSARIVPGILLRLCRSGPAMTEPPAASSADRHHPARVLRRLRQARKLRVAEVAAAMRLPVRTYVNLESGRTPATPARLRAFADATGCDLLALMLCAGGLAPDLVLACDRNKAIAIAIATLEDLHAVMPHALQTLTGADLLSAFSEAQRRLEARAIARSRARLVHDNEPDAALSPRQLECLRWAQAGKSSTDIGVILGISPRTVEAHLAQACGRLGVRTRIQAISLAIEIGLLSPRPP